MPTNPREYTQRYSRGYYARKKADDPEWYEAYLQKVRECQRNAYCRKVAAMGRTVNAQRGRPRKAGEEIAE